MNEKKNIHKNWFHLHISRLCHKRRRNEHFFCFDRFIFGLANSIAAALPIKNSWDANSFVAYVIKIFTLTKLEWANERDRKFSSFCFESKKCRDACMSVCDRRRAKSKTKCECLCIAKIAPSERSKQSENKTRRDFYMGVSINNVSPTKTIRSTE